MAQRGLPAKELLHVKSSEAQVLAKITSDHSVPIDIASVDLPAGCVDNALNVDVDIPANDKFEMFTRLMKQCRNKFVELMDEYLRARPRERDDQVFMRMHESGAMFVLLSAVVGDKSICWLDSGNCEMMQEICSLYEWFLERLLGVKPECACLFFKLCAGEDEFEFNIKTPNYAVGSFQHVTRIFSLAKHVRDYLAQENELLLWSLEPFQHFMADTLIKFAFETSRENQCQAFLKEYAGPVASSLFMMCVQKNSDAKFEQCSPTHSKCQITWTPGGKRANGRTHAERKYYLTVEANCDVKLRMNILTTDERAKYTADEITDWLFGFCFAEECDKTELFNWLKNLPNFKQNNMLHAGAGSKYIICKLLQVFFQASYTWKQSGEKRHCLNAGSDSRSSEGRSDESSGGSGHGGQRSVKREA